MNQIEVKHVKKGMYVILKSRPCKVIDYSISKTGKHGGVKVSLVGTDVINGNKIMDMRAGHKQIYEFKLDRSSHQLVNIEDNIIYYLKNNIEKNISIDVESEVYKLIKNYFDSGKNTIIIVITVPVEICEDKFTEEQLVESCKLDDN